MRVWLLIGSLCIGCGLSSQDFRPPSSYTVNVTYLSGYVKGVPQLSPVRVLVLSPVDQRQSLAIKGGKLPLTEGSEAIVGFWGRKSGSGPPPTRQRVLKKEPDPPHFPDVVYYRPIVRGEEVSAPDMPSTLFHLSELREVVQGAIVQHLHEGSLVARAVPFSLLTEGSSEDIQADYALGCVIEEFTLTSLVRYMMWRHSTPFIAITMWRPIFGPVLARVSLNLSLHRWPSGELVWTGKVAAKVTDPPAGDTELLHATPGDVMNVALSQAVGSILVNQELRDALSTPTNPPGQTLEAEAE